MDSHPRADPTSVTASGVPDPTAEQKISVLFLINQLSRGGTERSLKELAAALPAHGIEPRILSLKGSVDHPELEGLAVSKLEGSFLLSRVWELHLLLRHHPPDLLQTMLFDSDLVGRLAAAGTGVPVLGSLVNTNYDPVRRSDPNLRRGKLLLVKLVDRWTGRLLVDHFHALTQAVKLSAIDHLRIPPDRISVVLRGRDPVRLGRPSEARRQAARQRLGLSPEAEVVVTVGRQVFQKGHRFLLEAVARMAPGRPGLRVLIAGSEGPMTPELTALRGGLGLGVHVHFLGYRTDVPDVLAAADVFSFSSLCEGLGGSVIEAMALGLPIVCTDIPPLREIVEEGRNGLLVPPGEPGPLATALASLLDDPPRRRAFAARSREIFDERFRIERSAAEMAALYRRMAGAVR